MDGRGLINLIKNDVLGQLVKNPLHEREIRASASAAGYVSDGVTKPYQHCTHGAYSELNPLPEDDEDADVWNEEDEEAAKLQSAKNDLVKIAANAPPWLPTFQPRWGPGGEQGLEVEWEYIYLDEAFLAALAAALHGNTTVRGLRFVGVGVDKKNVSPATTEALAQGAGLDFPCGNNLIFPATFRDI